MIRINLKAIVFWFGILVILLFAFSCGTKKPIANHSVTVKDSTVTEVTYRKRDTTITIPGDTLKVRVPFYQLTPEPQLFQSGHQKATVSLSEDDLLTIDCITEEIKQLHQLIDTFKTTLNNHERINEVEIIRREPYTPWFIKIFAWIGVITVIVIAVPLIIKIIKK